MTKGKHAGEKAQAPLAFPRSHCSQMPRIHNHVRPLEEREGTEGLKEGAVQLYLMSMRIESGMLLNESYHSFPKRKLVALKKHRFRTETPGGSGAVHLPWSPGTTLRLSSAWVPPHSSRICLSQARPCPSDPRLLKGEIWFPLAPLGGLLSRAGASRHILPWLNAKGRETLTSRKPPGPDQRCIPFLEVLLESRPFFAFLGQNAWP